VSTTAVAGELVGKLNLPLGVVRLAVYPAVQTILYATPVTPVAAVAPAASEYPVKGADASSAPVFNSLIYLPC